MNDHSVSIGTYIEEIRSRIVLPASDIRYVEALHREGIPIWVILGAIASDSTITVERLAHVLVGRQEAA